MDILQVFVGRKSRALHSPLGALPVTVAPLRMFLVRMTNGGLHCLGKEARTTMAPDQRRRVVKGMDVLITILGRPPQVE